MDTEQKIDNLEKTVQDVQITVHHLEGRFTGLEKRFDGLEKRFDKLEGRFDTMEKSVYDLKVDVASIKAVIPHLATKGEVSSATVKIISIILGTLFALKIFDYWVPPAYLTQTHALSQSITEKT